MSMRLFQDLTLQEKIDFFVHGQELLLKHHPDSDFLIRQSNVKERITFAQELMTKYQGLCYMDENIIVLANKVFVTNEHNAVNTLKEHMFKPPVEHYNAVSIDFVVFRQMNDCMEWVRGNYDPRIRFVVYVKNGTPQIYPTEKLISKSLHVPMAVPPSA